VLADEPVERRIIAVPGNTDELHLAGVLLAGRLDRGGFVVAGASSGRPEPQRHRGVAEGTEVEVAPTHQWRLERKGLCRAALAVGPDRVGWAGCTVLRVRTARAEHRRREGHEGCGGEESAHGARRYRP